MLSARPEVKRTYSRLNKKGDEVTSEMKNDNDNINENKIVLNEVNDKLSSVQPRKITDFFRVKRKSLSSSTSETPEKLSKLKEQETDKNLSDSIKSSPISSVASKLKQTFLDLGQKNLVSTQCPECLMHFNKSFPDDVALHRKFHSNYLKGYNFNLNESSDCVEIGPEGEAVLKWAKYRFYALKAFDTALFKKLDFFLNFVHVQLGAESLTALELRAFDAVFAVDVASKKIVGFGLFEPCTLVYKSRVGCDESAIELEREPLSFNDFSICGVSRIWTDSNHRSKGLASLILDLKCGYKRDKLAFSQPTPAGFAFAKAYQRIHFDGQTLQPPTIPHPYRSKN